MMKECVFKCEGVNRGFVHVVKFTPETGNTYYRVMRNRRNIGVYPVYSELSYAISYAVRVSMNDITAGGERGAL